MPARTNAGLRIALAMIGTLPSLAAFAQAPNANQVKRAPVASTTTAPVPAVRCPNCGRVHHVSTNPKSHYQAEAEYEAQQMAARGYKGHIRGTIAGVRFCGVGWSSHSPSPPTCTPGSAMTLVADAVVRGRDGWYRVRYWR
ncbi:MAG: hypothetical protein D6753_04225 [Planctomycetota bacterium]|nr:MAG: hypothetical protein D6753_04225 [Planctomycetota bacterium]